jgi:hypothetical protein
MHGIKIRVIDDVERFTRDMDDATRRQVPFALARALTRTAQDAQGDVRTDLPRRFTIRNTWISRGIRITPASKTKPEAIVGSLEPFMARQETGGPKHARSHRHVAVPVKAKRNKRDIIPKGQRPAALKGKPAVFLLTTARGSGIMRREGKKRYPLQILYWLKTGVTVRPRFGFQDTTSDTVRKRFGLNFIASLSDAMGHRG